MIEAAPERVELKRELFAELSERRRAGLRAGDEHLLAARDRDRRRPRPDPERVVGMHFFNPRAADALLEVVAGEPSERGALAVARAAGEAMGKRVIDAADGPGFLVNRCNRPFGLEALQARCSERVATVEQIDRICRLGGGFRMGPFELMDLVGVDVGFDVSRSFYEQSFGEPRWRPSPITARTGRRRAARPQDGRGYYDYARRTAPSAATPSRRPPAAATAGAIVIAGELAARAASSRRGRRGAGWERGGAPAEAGDGAGPFLILD